MLIHVEAMKHAWRIFMFQPIFRYTVRTNNLSLFYAEFSKQLFTVLQSLLYSYYQLCNSTFIYSSFMSIIQEIYQLPINKNIITVVSKNSSIFATHLIQQIVESVLFDRVSKTPYSIHDPCHVPTLLPSSLNLSQSAKCQVELINIPSTRSNGLKRYQ